MSRNECVSECLFLQSHSSAQTLYRGERYLRPVNESVKFDDLRVLLFVCFRSVHGWTGMDL